MGPLALTGITLLFGCTEPPPDDPVPDPPSGVTLTPGAACESPRSGWTDFADVAAARGLQRPFVPFDEERCVPTPGHALAEDLDGDGDPDVVLHHPTGWPSVFGNDGGAFDPIDQPAGALASGRQILGLALIDLDDDPFPDLLASGEGFFATLRNDGTGRFDDPEFLLFEDGYPRGCYQSASAGDVDGDGWLDLFLPGLDELTEDEQRWGYTPLQGAADHLFLRRGETWEDGSDRLVRDAQPLTLMGFFTDRDFDGDPDLLVPPDRPYANTAPIAFFDNDGGVLTDRADAWSADLLVSGMGADSADLNGDGHLDYCITDLGLELRCLLSGGPDSYFEAGAALGLTVDDPTGTGSTDPADDTFWEGWSVDFVDLDHDGQLDAVAAAGLPAQTTYPRRDALWRGGAGGFLEVTEQVGFDADGQNNHGMATADFDGDGALEILVNGREGQPMLWDAGCTDGHWLRIELDGPAGNPRGLGATVVTELPDRTDRREVHGPRGWGQGPARVHVGLGDAEQARVSVHWPGGSVSELVAPADHVVRITHPDLVP